MQNAGKASSTRTIIQDFDKKLLQSRYIEVSPNISVDSLQGSNPCLHILIISLSLIPQFVFLPVICVAI